MIIRHSVCLAGRQSRTIGNKLCIKSRSLFGVGASLSKNRIFTPVRSEDDLTTLLNLPHGRNGRGPLITFWTASFDQQGCTIAENLKALIEAETKSLRDEENGIGFVEIETDAVTAVDLAPRYMIDTIPTLMAFKDSMAEYKTRVTDMNDLRDGSYLEKWLKDRSAGK